MAATPATSDRSDSHSTFVAIADYALEADFESDVAAQAALLYLLDALAAAFRSLKIPDCAKLLGPVVPGASSPGGARVLGTSYEFDPVMAAFNNGVLMCAYDADEPRADHPAANLGALLAVADFVARRDALDGKKRLRVQHVLDAMSKAHAIQRALECAAEANEAAFRMRNQIASAAMASVLLGAGREQVVAAVAHAWLDAQTGAGQSVTSVRWSAGDASSRAIRIALLASNNELAYPFTYPAGRAIDAAAHDDEAAQQAVERSVRLARPIQLDSVAFANRDAQTEASVMKKFDEAVVSHFSAKQSELIRQMVADGAALRSRPLAEFVARLVKN